MKKINVTTSTASMFYLEDCNIFPHCTSRPILRW